MTVHEQTQSPESHADFGERAFTTGRDQSNQFDPDGRWVARRQDAISDAFEKSTRLKGAHGGGAKVPSHDSSQDLQSSREPVGKLSGESDRIGRHEWDENTPFGKHVGFF